LFAARHWVDTIDPDELTPDSLAQRISDLFERPIVNNPNDPPNLHGAAAAANLTLSVLASKNDQVLTQCV
jgi:hypothetical protein